MSGGNLAGALCTFGFEGCFGAVALVAVLVATVTEGELSEQMTEEAEASTSMPVTEAGARAAAATVDSADADAANAMVVV